MSRKDERIAQLRGRIRELSPKEALGLQQDGALLIDVRESDEVAEGSPAGALRLTRGFLELRIEKEVTDPERTLLVMCGGGVRSLFAAEGLVQMGYQDVRSVAGGFHAWKSAGLPVELSATLDAADRVRYSRHLRIPEVGEEGQQRLKQGRVLLIGAGGLGSPAALYLAAAGVGTLGLVDDDRVDRSNLQRQILHKDWRVGTPKVDSARETLSQLNPAIQIETHQTRLHAANVEEIFAGYQVILDGSDNFPTRYLVSDACVKLGLPDVHGAIFRFEGQVAVFWPTAPGRRGPCYRCLFPAPPPAELAPSCAEAGVLGILPGVIGTLQAVETIKLLLGIGEPLVGRLLLYDALQAHFSEVRLERDPACPYCGDEKRFPGYVDYEEFCASRHGPRATP